MVNDSAIEKAHDQIGAIISRRFFIYGHWQPGFFLDFLEGIIGILNKPNIFSNKKIETVAEVYRRANHKWFLASAALLLLLCPFQGTKGIALPKIDTGAYPVVVASAWLQWLSTDGL